MDEKNQERKIVKIDIKKWKQKLGPDLFSKIIILLAGLNRLYALSDFLHLSYKTDKNRETARIVRNRATSVNLSFGILHELHNVLTHMNSLSLIRNNLPIHKKITAMIHIFDEKKWSSTLNAYRKFIAFHFNEEIIKIGLDEIKDQVVDLYTFDSFRRRDIYCEFADSIQFIGLMKKLVGDSQKEKFDDIFAEKSNEFYKYASELYKTIVKEIEELVGLIIEKFQLGKTESTNV
jgi:hypothetical protein